LGLPELARSSCTTCDEEDLGDPCCSQAVDEVRHKATGDATTLMIRIDGEFGQLEAVGGVEALDIAGE
jgi:hypothetical protein